MGGGAAPRGAQTRGHAGDGLPDRALRLVVLHQEKGVARSRRPRVRLARNGARQPGVSMTKAVLGIIGGSGIYDLPGLERVRQKKLKSPWGEPSAPLRIGEIAGLKVIFLSR